MGSFLKVTGQGAWASALRYVAEKITPSLVNAEHVEGWERGADGRLIPPSFPASLTARRQLEIVKTDDGGKVYYGEAYGLGFEGVITNTSEGEFTDFSGTKNVYLKIEFEPESEQRPISGIDPETGDEIVSTVYVLSNTGKEGEVTLEFLDGNAPESTDPLIDSDTGEKVQNGIYYRRVGFLTDEADTVSISQAFNGPVGLSFCAPDNLKIWEIRAS